MERGRPLVIVGTGEIARLADEYFTHDSPYEVVAFAAERAHLAADTFEGRPAVAFEELERHYPPDAFEVFVATSAAQLNRLRSRLFGEVKRRGYRCATYVSSAAHVWHNVPVGENCLIAECNVVQPFASIGDDVFVHSGNIIGHRSVVEDHCFVSAHVVVAGFCRIGSHSFLGLNVTFNDRTGVAADCIVASGSVVPKYLGMPGRVYHGSPATAIDGLRSQDVAL
jgi:sugar O-acyltransferase (sialic acid O-acetyltransferase NeuD family)